MRPDDLVRVRHMLDAVREAISFAKGRARADLDGARMLTLSLVKCIEIVGEAASKVTVEVLDGFRLRLTFDDGVVGEVDLEARIVGRGGVFEALEDPAFFRRVTVHRELATIVWPNDVDFCPDVLRHGTTGEPLPEEEASAGGAAAPHDHSRPI